jgi:hypothetical protein
MSKLSPQEKTDKAVERMEDAAMELLNYAKGYGENPASHHQAQNVLRMARRYSRSIDAVRQRRKWA